MTAHEAREALTLVATLYEQWKHALSFCYEPCDQTVQCPECGAVWWGVDKDIDENWHVAGCKLHEARVLIGMSKPGLPEYNSALHKAVEAWARAQDEDCNEATAASELRKVAGFPVGHFNTDSEK